MQRVTKRIRSGKDNSWLLKVPAYLTMLLIRINANSFHGIVNYLLEILWHSLFKRRA